MHNSLFWHAPTTIVYVSLQTVRKSEKATCFFSEFELTVSRCKRHEGDVESPAKAKGSEDSSASC